MNFLIGSDLHGSYKYGKMFIDKMNKYQIDKIILLGDLFYNGARNNPPLEYSPKDLVELLNKYADKIICVQGNCDSEVDQMVSHFNLSPLVTIFAFNKEIVLSHGHKYSFDNLPVHPGDIFIQGHTHKSVLEKKDNLILVNPGSVSLPKDEHHSYIILNDEGIKLFDLLNDQILKEIKF